MMLRRYRVAGMTFCCQRDAERFANESPIYVVEWPRPKWYKTPACRCGCNSGQNFESELNKQMTLF